MKRHLIVEVLIGLTAIFAITIAANATTRCVNPDGNSGCDAIIQTVINASANGDTILIYPGTYQQLVTINRSLTIKGLGEPCNVNIVTQTGNAITMAAGSSNTSISNLTITAGENGIYCNQAITFYVYNCKIANCGVAGISLNGDGGTLFVSNCVICGNSAYGIRTTRNNWYVRLNLYVYGNILYGNYGAGIYYLNQLGVNLNQYNCVFGNSPNYGGDALPGTGDISLDPQFESPDSCNYHFLPGSPCIDEGRPGVLHYDCDGSFNDMGVYGGPYADCGPGPVVTELQIVPNTVIQGDSIRILATGAAR